MKTRTVRAILLLAGAALAGMARAEPYKTTFVSLDRGEPALLLEPASPGLKASVGVFAMHDNADLLQPQTDNNPCDQLAKRGYRVLCANSSTSKSGFFTDDDIEKLLLNVKHGVAWLKGYAPVKRVVIFGHSGGGEMMAAYQNVAEHGVAACRGSRRISPCTDALAGLPAADGVMLIDSVMGGPVSTLISLDPAVKEDDAGTRIDPALDMYNPANGFRPTGSTYSDDFKRRFFAEQGARMNRLIDTAEQRLKKIEAGQGRFADDEVFVIAGANGALNRLNAQDLTLQSSTRQAWPLLHANGRVTTEVVHSVRVPRFTQSTTPMLNHGAITTTVRRFLSTWAVRTKPDFGYDATSYHGIDYPSSWAVEDDSIAGITKPLLQMGMTGSYEFFTSEQARMRAGSADKTLAYVEGATHDFQPCHECAVAAGHPADYYGDTVKTLFDYIDGWLSKPGRFIQAGAR